MTDAEIDPRCRKGSYKQDTLIARRTMDDWQALALELHGETEEELRNAINALKENIAEKGLKNIVYEKDDDFLARFIRTSKYDVAKAFRMLNGYYLNRASLPHKVAPRGKGPKDTEFYVPLKSIMILDRKNWDGSSVLIFRQGDWDKINTKAVLADMLFFGFYVVEAAMRDPIVQLQGLTVVFDCSGFGIRHLPFCDMAVFRYLLSCVNGSYPMRLRAIHVLSCPAAFRFVLNLFRNFLTPKMRARLHVHSSSANLDKYIDGSILPEEYSSTSTSGPFSSTRIANPLKRSSLKYRAMDYRCSTRTVF
ncbi:alpha-tocopherol transfer protein-like isoform X2 [Varroa destructor]|uniref:CRAL-TRIO domain-containing protein n=1 Tax=Varroa destructor TaxID=109461 RepID=A0A7M7J5L6_VARDE|nr:alpha-tocopherol transfer protein-like isoform X2 [Varroa destructor]XP_022647148.1 alpha-tocopherol transfer protein-like isoform X2 [Varroa destructor]